MKRESNPKEHMNVPVDNFFVSAVLHHIQHYNPKKYWKYRAEVVNPHSRKPRLVRLWYLLYIKRCDAFNNASMGTDMGYGAVFKTPPKLPHHLNGIIVSHHAVIGENCTIAQQVTIAQNHKGAPVIGDNCFISAGARIVGNVHIGNNVRIGANAVVVHDLPDNCTAVGVPAKVVRIRTQENETE